jgi:energy-coupling factor transport system substrate-specific component
VALVAALSALAVAGRLVLAPIPNVVATTDIALITGYALGGAPGFAVGALAAPISNIWLGQGPWTPWEMAGWGLVGIGGAWVAAITGRRLGRLGLATVCGLAGFAYGALLDYSLMATYGGEQSLDRYLALSARGVPFNVAHAVGNFVIALAAGPALVRMISRYRTRLEFTWRPPIGATPVAILAVVLGIGLVSVGGRATAAGVERAAPGSSVSWLAGTQNSDGGFGSTTDYPSSPAMTGWVALGLEAAGRNPLDVRAGGESAVAYLRANRDRLKSVGDLERTILTLTAASVDPRSFGGDDLVAELRERRDGDGSVDGQVNLTAFYVLAMRAAGVASSDLGRSGGWLRDAQNSDGGFGIQPKAPSEADSTGAALQALAAAGSGGGSASDAVRYLRKSQRKDGSWALASTGIANAQSTAWAIQGLVAAGSGGGPVDHGIDYLGSLRAADGHYSYSKTSDQTPVWVTAQVLLALERRPFPIPAVARSLRTGGGGSGGSGGSSSTGAGSGAEGAGFGAGGSAAGSGGGGGPGGSGGSGAGGQRGGSKPGAGESAATGQAVTEDEAAPEATVDAAPLAATTPAENAADDGGSATPWVAGGFAALILALTAGFLWFRRRLD